MQKKRSTASVCIGHLVPTEHGSFLVQEAHDAEPRPPRTFTVPQNPSLWKMFCIQGGVSCACLLTNQNPTRPSGWWERRTQTPRESKNGPGGDHTEAVRIGFSPWKLF